MHTSVCTVTRSDLLVSCGVEYHKHSRSSAHPKITALYPTVVTLRNCSRFSIFPSTWYNPMVTCTLHGSSCEAQRKALG